MMNTDQKFLNTLSSYKVTMLCALAVVVVFLALYQGWLLADALYYFQDLRITRFDEPTWLAEPWRFLSPIFLHHTPLHMLTNLVVWGEFARQIEKQQGSWTLLFLVVLIGISSNTVEFFMVDHRFGGLSGVVIGQGAYIGLLSLKPNQDDWDFPPVYWLALIGLFVLDMGGQNTQAAHYVHGTGLVIGLVCGAVLWQMQQKKDNLTE